MSYVIPSNQVHYRLPSIHSLDLDLPVPKYQHQSNSNGQLQTPVSLYPYPLYAATGVQQQQHAIVPISEQLAARRMVYSQPIPQVNVPPHQQQQAHSHLPFVSPILSPSFKNNATDSLSALCAVASSSSSSRSRLLSDPAQFSVQQGITPVSPVSFSSDIVKRGSPQPILIFGSSVDNGSAHEEIGSAGPGSSSEDHEDEVGAAHSALSTANLALNSSTKPTWKPRKKRQCPECKLFFSNLATHKSTHLKPTSRPHVCEYCSRGFARPNDLFRHVKCHWKETGSDKGQFKCPFKSNTSGDHCCHSTGIFSRCDTFKNHLKAIHFQYPTGTKKDQRNKVAGSCRACHQHFNNVDEWVSNHVEKNSCPYAGEYAKH